MVKTIIKKSEHKASDFWYNNLTVGNELAKNTFYLTFAAIGQKIMAFVYFLFLARIMMPEQTGMYFLATSFIMIFSVVADFGITPVIVREIAKHPEETVDYARKAFGLKLLFVGLGAVLTIITISLLGYEPIIQQLVWIGVFVLILDAIHLFFYGILRGHQKLRYESLGMFFGQLVIVSAGGLVLWLHPSLYFLMIALMLGSVVNVGISGLMSARKFGFKIIIPKLEKSSTKKLLKIAFPFALAALFMKVYSYIDTIFISKFLDVIALGIYSVAYKFTYAFQFIPLSFVAALYPGLSSVVDNDKKALHSMFERSMWYMMLIATPIVFGLYAIAPEVVSLAGGEYAESARILQLLVFVLFPLFLDFPIGSLLNAANRQSTKTAIMGITMVINVILNFILIPTVGLVGAVYAAIVSFVFMFFAGAIFIPKIIPTFKFTSLAKSFLGIIVSGLVMLVLAIYAKPIIGYGLVIPVAAVAYLVMLRLTNSINKEDLRDFCKLFKTSV